MTRVEDPPAAERAGRLAQRDHLGVGGGIVAQLALVVSGADELAVLDDHGSDRHVIVLERPFSLAQGEAHEVLVSGEEMLCSPSRGRALALCRATFGRPMMS